jgi:uncharacterized phage protein gp47/JayE
MTSNYIDITGLHLQILADIITELEDGFKAIYGNDINVAANSPDGQMINLFAQAKMDSLDLINSVYSSFSPSSAAGVVLDQRCAINGIIRKGATKTTAYVVVTTDRIVNLVGLSSNSGTPFTVSDTSGNKYYLTTDTTTASGANSLHFTAAIAGAVDVSPATITTIETVTLGVVSVSNTGGATIQGIDEETDAALRYRRSVSVSNPSTGALDGLMGALLAIEDVLYAKVYENNTGTTDTYGIPAHSIWAVVDSGSATGTTGIAQTIYERRNVGCGMYYGTGSTGVTGQAKTVNITQLNGYDIPIKFSTPTYYDLYIDLTVTSKLSTHSVDETFLKNEIYAGIQYDINELADYSDIASLVKASDPLVVITSGGVGLTGLAPDPYLAPPTIDGRWIISTAKININTV